MSSEPNDFAGRGIAVGETCCLFLAPYPGDFDAMAGAAAGRHVFQCPAGECTLLDFGRSRPALAATSLADFVMHGPLPAEARTALLHELFGSRIGRSILLDDQSALATLFELSGKVALVGGKATLHRIRGCPESVLVYPRAVELGENDSVFCLSAGRFSSATVVRTGRFLVRQTTGLRLAALDGDHAFDGDTLVVVSAGTLATLQLDVIEHATADDLHAQTARANVDVLQMFVQAGRTIRPLLLERMAADRPKASVSDPAWGLHFELDGLHQLANGYFISGWFTDPEERLLEAVIVDYRLEQPDILEYWIVSDEILQRNDTRALAKRFRAFVPGRLAGDAFPPRLRLSLRGGTTALLGPPTTIHETAKLRDAILATVEDRTFSPELFKTVYAPALAPLQETLNGRQRIRSAFSFGPRSERRTSIVIPLYGQLGFIRPQLMAFLQDRYLRETCQILYALDDPRLVGETQALLEGYRAWAKLDTELLVLDRNGGYAMANNTAATRAEGEHIVLMNSDVIPIQPGWLETALECLHAARPFSVVGPKLLYGDDSLQHAGMYFEKFPHGYFQNLHYWKGYGRTYAPALAVRPVPAVTGACMLLRTADFREVGGFTPDYILGDYEDSDLCLKLRRRGGTCIYVPSAELYHFERQSMPKIEDAHDRRSTIYNRALHTARWHDEIAGLMAEFA